MSSEKARQILRDYLDPDVDFAQATVDAVIAAILAAELEATPEAERIAEEVAPCPDWCGVGRSTCEDQVHLGRCPVRLRPAIAAAITRALVSAETEQRRLHALVAEARNYIDPEQQAAWEAGALAELGKCDERVAALEAELAQIKARPVRAWWCSKCPGSVPPSLKEDHEAAFVNTHHKLVPLVERDEKED